MSDARHRSPGTGGLGDGLRRGEKIATAWSEWRFGEPPPGARGAPPEAHEPLVSRENACGSAVDRAILPIYGDAIEEVVKWNSGSDVSTLVGKPIRLRFVMTDADLYSIRFRD